MALIKVTMKTSGEPVKRMPLTIQFDDSDKADVETATDRTGSVVIEEQLGSGRVMVNGSSHYQGSLDKEIQIELWSLTGGSNGVGTGAPPGIGGGSIAYPSMQIDHVMVNGQKVETCSEGYIVNPEQWSEAFTEALAEKEGLELTDEIWEVLRYLRDFYSLKHVQCTVRDVIKYFHKTWGKERGNNKYLHQIFPRGGPQKQGNRLAGLLRTKGEH